MHFSCLVLPVPPPPPPWLVVPSSVGFFYYDKLRNVAEYISYFSWLLPLGYPVSRPLFSRLPQTSRPYYARTPTPCPPTVNCSENPKLKPIILRDLFLSVFFGTNSLDQCPFVYRKIPVISRGLIQLRKGFLVGKRKLFWQGRIILANEVWLHGNNCCKGAVTCLYQEGGTTGIMLCHQTGAYNWVGL